MDHEDENTKQRDPYRGHVGPGVETGPPTVESLLRLGQGANFLRIADCDYPGRIESGRENGSMHSAADAEADPVFGSGFAHVSLPLPSPLRSGGTVADRPAGDIARNGRTTAMAIKG